MDMIRAVAVAGVDHRSASVAARESIAVPMTEAGERLHRFADRHPHLEAVVLSTCNRTEVWVAGEQVDAASAWDELIGSSALTPTVRHGIDAIRHTLRVACGLESAILGDVGILRQMREAIGCAAAAGTVGDTLQDLSRRAQSTGRRARSETEISWGAAGVGSAATAAVVDALRHLRRRGRVVIVGAGEVGSEIAALLAKRNAVDLTIVNRSTRAAVELAREIGGIPTAWDDLAGALLWADVVVTATGAPAPIIDAPLLERVRDHRGLRPLVLVDLGLPRNVEAVSGVEVIPIDGIAERRRDVEERRRDAIPAVERLVEDELAAWKRWVARRPLELLVKELHLDAEALSRDTALDIASADRPLSAREAERLVHTSVKRLLHRHVTRLRSLSDTLEVMP